MRYAIMRDNVVTGLTTFDDEPPEGWSAGEGLGLFPLQDGQEPAPGWVWEGGEFHPPVEEVAPTEPRRVSCIDFSRLFRGPQQIKINAWRKQVAALTSEDYADPTQALAIQLELVFQAFDLPDEFIELDHPDLTLALGLLAYAGVFGDDPAVIASETARIIAGGRPV